MLSDRFQPESASLVFGDVLNFDDFVIVKLNAVFRRLLSSTFAQVQRSDAFETEIPMNFARRKISRLAMIEQDRTAQAPGQQNGGAQSSRASTDYGNVINNVSACHAAYEIKKSLPDAIVKDV